MYQCGPGERTTDVDNDIQSHTMTHVHFNDEEIESIDYDYQLLKSKQILEELTGKEVHTLAYPYGAVNDVVLAEVQKYYRYAVLVQCEGSGKPLPVFTPVIPRWDAWLAHHNWLIKLNSMVFIYIYSHFNSL